MLTALRLEFRKIRPGLLLTGAIGLPMLVTVAKLVGFIQRRNQLVTEDRWNWEAFYYAAGFQWYALVLPILTASLAAYLCAVEFENGTWKNLLSQPLPKWQLWLTKFFCGVLILTVMAASLTVAHVLAGFYLNLNGELGPRYVRTLFLLPLGQGAILAFHLWLATRSRHFLLPVGAAMIGIIVTQLVENRFVTFSLPWIYSNLPLYPSTGAVPWTMAAFVALSLTLVLAGLACFDFTRRDWRE